MLLPIKINVINIIIMRTNVIIPLLLLINNFMITHTHRVCVCVCVIIKLCVRESVREKSVKGKGRRRETERKVPSITSLKQQSMKMWS